MKTKWSLSRGWALGLGAVGGAVALVLAAFVAVSLSIGGGVRAAAAAAMGEYAGDEVGALIRCVEDGGQGLRERNRAAWALGQLGDRRALPALRKQFTGGPCEHGRALCQRELGKAIGLLEGGVNLTAVVWRD